MAYELFETPVHGRVLAQHGKVVILPKNKAYQLAERFSGTAIKSVTGNYMIKLPDWANDISECDCGGSGMVPDMIDFRMGQQPAEPQQHQDHEVQMARSQLYRTAKLAIMLHDLLKNVDERQGLEGWVQSKLTRAADYIETVYGYLDYEHTSGQMYTEAGAGTGVGVAPVQPIGGTTTVPNQATNTTDGKTKTPGMVKMAKVDMNGKIQGTPIMVPVASIKSKQQAGFRVIGESASAGASSAGGIASTGNGFLNGGPGSTLRRRTRTTEEWETLEPGKPFGLANPRIMTVGDDPQGIYDFAVTGRNVLSINPFNANQWSNHQYHARNKGYMLKYVGKDPRKAEIAHSGDTPRTGYNMAGQKLEGVVENETGVAPNPALRRIILNNMDEVKYFVKTGELDQTGDLFYQMYEYYANEIPVHIRQNPRKLARTLTAKIAPMLKYYGTKTTVMNGQGVTEGLKDPKDNPCWKGYHPVGTKKKNGKTVPNCVPGRSDEAANPAQQAAIAIAKKKKKGIEEGEMQAYEVTCMDAATGEHWVKTIRMTSPEAAKERAESQGYKVKSVKLKDSVKEGETGPKFTGYWKGTDKGKPGKKMVGDA